MLRLGLLLVLIGPVHRPPEDRFPPEQRWLTVVPGATDVTRQSGPAWLSTYYEVKEPYPATRTVSQVLEFMSRGGWTLVSKAWSDAEPSEHGVHKMRHSWRALWQDEAVEFDVSYRLDYTCRFEELGLHSAWATVSVGIVDRAEYKAYVDSVRSRERDRAVQEEDELRE